MTDLLALLFWLTGQPPQEPPANDPGTVTAQGGGIPIKPNAVDGV
jgi:hypothetical protein